MWTFRFYINIFGVVENCFVILPKNFWKTVDKHCGVWYNKRAVSCARCALMPTAQPSRVRYARLLAPIQAVIRKFAWTKFRASNRSAQSDIFLSQAAWHTRGRVRQCEFVVGTNCCCQKNAILRAKKMQHFGKAKKREVFKNKNGNTKNEN